MPVTAQDMMQLSKMIQQLCGLALDDSKGYLIESRLAPLVEDAGCHGYVQLCRKAIAGDRSLRSKVIDAITTHETLFFRDDSPFSALQFKVIPDLIDSKAGGPHAKRIRIWSAACSSGQEPYSIAMALSEMIPDITRWDANILGTDIADSSIAQASRGIYTDYEMGRGMKPQLRDKYFTQIQDRWKVADSLRSLIRFQQRNLLESCHDLGPFDVIFCRNVAIYFDAPTRKALFERVASRLTPNGYLFVGASESLADLGPNFAPKVFCRSVFYQPNAAPARR